jgi:hypothetical protein
MRQPLLVTTALAVATVAVAAYVVSDTHTG